MQTPAFFDAAPVICVVDPLADMLGAVEGGAIEYRYEDAVKLAGHSCPTVVGGWLMTREALARLYTQEPPRRGEIRVELRQSADEGVAGVVGAVAGLVTGAAGEGGFRGLASRFARQGLLHFGVPMQGRIRFTRVDNSQSVEPAYRPGAVPAPAGPKERLPSALGPQASDASRQALRDAWQGWVRTILIDHADDPALVHWVA